MKNTRTSEMPARIVQTQKAHLHVVPLTMKAVMSGPRYGLVMMENST